MQHSSYGLKTPLHCQSGVDGCSREETEVGGTADTYSFVLQFSSLGTLPSQSQGFISALPIPMGTGKQGFPLGFLLGSHREGAGSPCMGAKPNGVLSREVSPRARAQLRVTELFRVGFMKVKRVPATGFNGSTTQKRLFPQGAAAQQFCQYH